MWTSCWRRSRRSGTTRRVGTFTFRASSRWQDGRTTLEKSAGSFMPDRRTNPGTRRFGSKVTNHPCLLGRNKGPNAVELLLQALGFCYAVGYAANAAARGIEINAMEYELEGDL